VKPLYGEFDLGIDEKCRLSIPAELRRAIDPEKDGTSFYVVEGDNGALWLYVESIYESMAFRSETDLMPEPDLVEFDQLSFTLATKVDLDAQGRVLIQEKILRRAGLGKEITLIGVRDHIELWNREAWLVQREKLRARRQEIAERARHLRHARSQGAAKTN